MWSLTHDFFCQLAVWGGGEKEGRRAAQFTREQSGLLPGEGERQGERWVLSVQCLRVSASEILRLFTSKQVLFQMLGEVKGFLLKFHLMALNKRNWGLGMELLKVNFWLN